MDNVALYGNLNIIGRCRISVFELGNLVREEVVSNRVVAAGRTWMLNRIAGLSGKTLYYFAIGDGGDGSVSDGDTELVSELMQGRVTRFSVTGNDMLVEYYLPSGDTDTLGKTLKEAGLFTNTSFNDLTQVLVARIGYTPVEKTANNAILYSWTITLAVG